MEKSWNKRIFCYQGYVTELKNLRKRLKKKKDDIVASFMNTASDIFKESK